MTPKIKRWIFRLVCAIWAVLILTGVALQNWWIITPGLILWILCGLYAIIQVEKATKSNPV